MQNVKFLLESENLLTIIQNDKVPILIIKDRYIVTTSYLSYFFSENASTTIENFFLHNNIIPSKISKNRDHYAHLSKNIKNPRVKETRPDSILLHHGIQPTERCIPPIISIFLHSRILLFVLGHRWHIQWKTEGRKEEGRDEKARNKGEGREMVDAVFFKLDVEKREGSIGRGCRRGRGSVHQTRSRLSENN